MLIVDVEPRRGAFRPERYDDIAPWRVSTNPVRRNDLRWLAEDATTLFSSETFYVGDGLPTTVNVRLALLANPELFPPSYLRCAERGLVDVYAPTEWEVQRLGPHRMLRQPVATDHFTPHVRTGPATTFLHISSPAMLDRNGTQLVRAACEVYKGPPILVFVSGPSKPLEATHVSDNVLVVPVGPHTNYWEQWTDAIDCFVQPRRYGGLSMVVSEAAAAGIPSIVLDRFPENSWPGTFPVRTIGADDGVMKGGTFPVARADARDVADKMLVAATTDELGSASSAARWWAESISWHRLLASWNEALYDPVLDSGLADT